MPSINVLGRRFAFETVGRGPPTFVLETGLGVESDAWARVVEVLKASGGVFRYDRPGRGSSGPAAAPRATPEMVADLKRVLEATGTPGPYVLIGQSFGGLVARRFANTYRDEVVGLVLVESIHRDQFARLAPRYPEPSAGDAPELARMRGFWREGWRTPESTPEHIDFGRSFAADAEVESLGALPLKVISADAFLTAPFLPAANARSLHDGWMELQLALTKLSTCSDHVIAHGSGHFVQLDRPALVSAAAAAVLR